MLLVDVQNDFCPGGALAVGSGDEVVAPLNEYIARFTAAGLSGLGLAGLASRTDGAFPVGRWSLAATLRAGHAWGGVSRRLATAGRRDHRDERRRSDRGCVLGLPGARRAGSRGGGGAAGAGVGHLFVGGLATDYCVRSTVLDGLRAGFGATVLLDAIRGVNVAAGDAERAIAEMVEAGAAVTTLGRLELSE